MLCKVCQKQRSHIEKFVFPTFFSHRLRPSRMVQFVCACFIEVNMISLTQSIRIREGILKTPAKGKPYAFHMIVSRIRKNGPVGRSHGFRTALLRTWVGINTDDIPKRRNIIDWHPPTSHASSCSRNRDSQQCLTIVGNEELFCKKVFFGDATECPKYSSV